MKKLLLIFTFLFWLPLAHANDAEFNRAFDAYESGDYQTAFTIYKNLAEQGIAQAQAILGAMYENGDSVPQNYDEALKWYSKSAEQRYAPAQNNLGVMYYFGKGVPKNYDEAFKWYSKAAEQGHAEAQYNLGVMYGKGEGTPENHTKAYVWASIAIVNGYEKAKNVIQLLEKEMDSASITEAQKLAKQCRESKYKNCGDDNLLNKKAESDGILKKIFKPFFLYLKHEFSILLYGGIIFLVVAGLIAISNLFRKK